jgi:SprT-like family
VKDKERKKRERTTMASTRRTSPRKKAAIPAVTGGGELELGKPQVRHALGDGRGRSGSYRAESLHDEEEDDDDDDDDLPDLATLLDCRSMSRSVKGRTQGTASNPRVRGERSEEAGMQTAPDKNKKKTHTVRIPTTAPSRNEDSEGTSIPTATPPTTSTPSLVLSAKPALQPTGRIYLPPPTPIAGESASADQETTVTTARSSRQQIQRQISLEKKKMRPLSPAKRSVLASPTKKTKEDTYSGSGISLSNAALHGATRNISSRNSKAPKPATVDSLLLPLSGLALSPASNSQGNNEDEDEEDIFQTKPPPKKTRFISTKRTTKRAPKARGAMFVLKEAACRDDNRDEEDDQDSDEEATDLSGFIVDDDAEISFVDSGPDSDEDVSVRPTSPVRRKLVRGKKDISDVLRSLSLEDEEDGACEKGNTGADILAEALAEMDLGAGNRETGLGWSGRSEVEVIDLTSSPVKRPVASRSRPEKTMSKGRSMWEDMDEEPISRRRQDRFPSSASDSAETGEEGVLRYSPPEPQSPFKLDNKKQRNPLNEASINTLQTTELNSNTITTPPHTPPASPTKLRSPTKLNSPSKTLLLSPSKRAAQIPQSPHRQSIDAFWSSEVINEWNDQYSPEKPPLTVSPKKKWRIWEDQSDSGSESPCESPARRIGSPAKVAKSPSKKAVIDEKKAAVSAKRMFDEKKVSLAQDLLKDLDDTVSDGKLAQLSQSTGGVKIIWSKNLRSTAGRANWRRTVTKASTGSPVKCNAAATDDAKIHHFASIELAEKVIDNEERLVNTLAHEYCHLANFMVSGIRDQPHGASFKSW